MATGEAVPAWTRGTTVNRTQPHDSPPGERGTHHLLDSCRTESVIDSAPLRRFGSRFGAGAANRLTIRPDGASERGGGSVRIERSEPGQAVAAASGSAVRV